MEKTIYVVMYKHMWAVDHNFNLPETIDRNTIQWSAAPNLALVFDVIKRVQVNFKRGSLDMNDDNFDLVKITTTFEDVLP
jgi:hypothetical protein